MFQSIQKLIKQTAKDLNMDLSTVEKVVMSEWLFVKNNFGTPHYPVVRLEDLGKFEIPPHANRYYFKQVRKKLLHNPQSVQYNKAIKDIAAIRYPVQKYWLSRQFKKRFGSWHYKSSNT